MSTWTRVFKSTSDFSIGPCDRFDNRIYKYRLYMTFDCVRAPESSGYLRIPQLLAHAIPQAKRAILLALFFGRDVPLTLQSLLCYNILLFSCSSACACTVRSVWRPCLRVCRWRGWSTLPVRSRRRSGSSSLLCRTPWFFIVRSPLQNHLLCWRGGRKGLRWDFITALWAENDKRYLLITLTEQPS